MSLDDFPELAKLKISEKIILVENLWDSIISDDSEIPIPQSHIDELDKRFQNIKNVKLLSLEEFKARVENHK